MLLLKDVVLLCMNSKAKIWAKHTQTLTHQYNHTHRQTHAHTYRLKYTFWVQMLFVVGLRMCLGNPTKLQGLKEW